MRISFLQNNNKNEANKHHEKPMSNLPILTLDELLTKELALSYYLDYLSIMNLQKYVIFYLVAQGEYCAKENNNFNSSGYKQNSRT